jgi:predicted DNA-binding protein (MmcQ/YjbR family)
MNITTFDATCAALPGVEKVVQWGGRHVWKVDGRIFAIATPAGDKAVLPSFKASDAARPMLLERPGLAPAPYLARAGWVCLTKAGALDDEALAAYLGEAHRVIAQGRKRRGH